MSGSIMAALSVVDFVLFLSVAGVLLYATRPARAPNRKRLVSRREPDPLEGLVAMRAPLDYLIMGALGVGSFVLSFVGYAKTAGNICWSLDAQSITHCGIFDETYFARAGEEYLRNLRIYENTHPPLSKLLVTLSMMLFGGLAHGDNPYGWRFLDVVFGALTVMLLFAFAKRVTGSTRFATIAALLLTLDGMHFVQSRIATPEGFVVFFALLATYALYRFWICTRGAAPLRDAVPVWRVVAGAGIALVAGAIIASIAAKLRSFDAASTIVTALYLSGGIYLFVRYRVLLRQKWKHSTTPWLLLFAIALGCLVSSKWYGVMDLGVGFVVLVAVWMRRPRRFHLDGVLVTVLFVSTTVYALAWAPDLLRKSPDPGEIHTLNDVIDRQRSMFEYHDTLRATHPYASKWWEWPFDYVPVAYYYSDARRDKDDPNGCCIYEITTMPNPAILWFGLFAVPFVALLAWRERNRAYALIVLTYILQWLPWMFSPRIAWEYHFYVDIPLICLCNTIVLQRSPRVAVVSYIAAVAAAFVFFYPILAAHGLTWNAWNQRMWMRTWIIGPG